MICFIRRIRKKAILFLFALLVLLFLPIRSKAADGDLKWTFTLPTPNDIIFSSPAIAPDGTIYVGTGKYGDTFYAINTDGSEKWHYATGTGIYSSPAVDEDGTIYFVKACCSCDMYALNPNGTYKWSISLSSSCSNTIYSSPGIASDGTIYIGSGYKVLWVDSISVKKTCQHNTKFGYVDSSAAITSSNVFYIGDPEGYLHSLGPGCQLNWKFKTGDEVWSSPAIASDGTIYVGSDDNKLYALNSGGTLKWSFATGGDVWSSPAIAPDGTIYVGSGDNNLYAVHPDGKLKWAFATGDEVGSSPAIAADGTIYVGSLDGKLYAVHSDGKLKWAFKTGGAIRSSPAIAEDGTVYVGSYDGKLYAFEDNTGGLAVSAWPMFRHDVRHTGNVSTALEGDPLAELSVEPVALNLNAAETRMVTISGGISPYRAVSSDDDVSTVSLNGNRLTVTGAGQGSAILTITDSNNASVCVDVTVTGPVATVPPAVTLSSPSGNIEDATPTLTWNAEPTATWYYVWVNKGDTPVYQQWYTSTEVCSGGICSVTSDSALSRGNYQWWIQTWNDEGYGPWSDGMSFYVESDDGTLQVAQMISPVGSISQEAVTYAWNAVDNATWYYLWINDAQGCIFNQWYTAGDVEQGDGTCAMTPDIDMVTDEHHTWWIQSWNDGGYSDWSDGVAFWVEEAADDCSGIWKGNWDSYYSNSGTITMDLVHSGNRLSGTMDLTHADWENETDIPFSGTIDNDEVTISASAQDDGDNVALHIQGTVSGNAIEGSYYIYVEGVLADSGSFGLTKRN